MKLTPRYILRIGNHLQRWISPHAAWEYARYAGYVVERIA